MLGSDRSCGSTEGSKAGGFAVVTKWETSFASCGREYVGGSWPLPKALPQPGPPVSSNDSTYGLQMILRSKNLELSHISPKILQEFLFHWNVPEIDEGKHDRREGNQTINYLLLDFRLCNQRRRGRWKEESIVQREVERILELQFTKKAGFSMKKTGMIARSRAPNIEEFY